MKLLNFDRILCLSAHPDDVEYGMLGSINKYKNTKFDILVFSHGGDFDPTTYCRKEECKTIWDKIPNVTGEFLSDKEKSINNMYIKALTEDKWVNIIENTIDLTAYDCIFTLPQDDSQFEHKIINNITYALIRNKKLGLVTYRSPSTLDSWVANCFVEIDLDKKIKLLTNFISQKHRLYFNEISIKEFHINYQCSRRNIKYVEYFKIERIYS